jgi:hypothetical protein
MPKQKIHLIILCETRAKKSPGQGIALEENIP